MLQGFAGGGDGEVYVVDCGGVDRADLLFSSGRVLAWHVGNEMSRACTYAGLIVASFCSLLDLTNSLLIKSPTGCDHFLPLGAVSSTSMFLRVRVCEKYDGYEDEKGRVSL